MTVTAKITAQLTGSRVVRKPNAVSQSFAQTNERANDITVSVSTAEQDLAIGDLESPKYLLLFNASTSTADTITYGPKSSSGVLIPLGILRYDEANWVSLASSAVTVRVMASGSSIPLDTSMWDA